MPETPSRVAVVTGGSRGIGRLAAQPPLERLGAPADIAEVVAFLASPTGHWINGQVVRPNDGII